MTIYDLLKNSSPSMAKHFNKCEEETRVNTEEIDKLKTRVSNLENSGGSGSPEVYEPATRPLVLQSDFEVKNRLINNVSCTAYFQYFTIGSTTPNFTFSPFFTPHCIQYEESGDSKVYTEIPIMDFEDEVYLNPNKLGIAIKRQFNSEGKLADVYLLVTKKLFDSLANGDNSYIVYLATVSNTTN